MTTSATTRSAEASLTFSCFGGRVSIHAAGPAALEPAVEDLRRRFATWHELLTRFDPNSELSRLNADEREQVPVSGVTCSFVEAAIEAARRTGGLVDPTLVDEVEAAGYRDDLERQLPLEVSLVIVQRRRPARPNPAARWRQVHADRSTGIVTRPPGMRLDSGGIAKGLFADLAGRALAGAEAYAVDCCGDLRLGGGGRVDRLVRVDDPFGRGVLHEFTMTTGGVATSGIGRRSWLDADGRPAHHLLDPSTGRPAFTGIVQATALARTAGEAELRAKAALLSGPQGARDWLPEGGVLVYDDGSHEVIER